MYSLGYESAPEGKSSSNSGANSCQQNLFPFPRTAQCNSATDFNASYSW